MAFLDLGDQFEDYEINYQVSPTKSPAISPRKTTMASRAELPDHNNSLLRTFPIQSNDYLELDPLEQPVYHDMDNDPVYFVFNQEQYTPQNKSELQNSILSRPVVKILNFLLV
jgi:hypothetical protein